MRMHVLMLARELICFLKSEFHRREVSEIPYLMKEKKLGHDKEEKRIRRRSSLQAPRKFQMASPDKTPNSEADALLFLLLFPQMNSTLLLLGYYFN